MTLKLKTVLALLLATVVFGASSGVALAYVHHDGLEAGDILFAVGRLDMEPDDEVPFTNSPGSLWEHVALYIGDDKVVEAIYDEYGSVRPGTRTLALDDFLGRWQYVEVKRLNRTLFWRSRIIARLQVQRNQVIQAAIDYSLKHAELQTPYNWQANKFDESSLYCSQLVWNAFYEVASIDLDSNGGINVTPDDVYASKLLHRVDWQPSVTESQNPD